MWTFLVPIMQADVDRNSQTVSGRYRHFMLTYCRPIRTELIELLQAEVDLPYIMRINEFVILF